MKFKDLDHRVLAELSPSRLQLGAFSIQSANGPFTGIIIGFNRSWLSNQKKLRECSHCHRAVPSPCFGGVRGDEGYYESGPWDSWCRDLVNPQPGDPPIKKRMPWPFRWALYTSLAATIAVMILVSAIALILWRLHAL